MRRREFLGTVAAQAAAGTLQRFDVVVVGAGVFGACTAHLLRKSGKKVALLDAYGAGNSRASSGGESRIIRMGYGKAEVYTRWSHASLGWWRDFFKRTGHPLFHQTGVLWMSHADDVRTRESRATLERLRIPFEAIAEAELARRYPQIRFPGMIGTLEPESGALAARQAVQAVVADAVRNGCEYIPDAVAQPRGKGKLDTVATNSGRKIPANVFVFACGPWLGKLFPDLLGNRIFPSRQEVFFFGIPAGDRRFAPPALPVWIDFSIPAGPYGFPDLEARGFKLAFDAHGPPFDPDTGDRIVSGDGVAAARKYIAERFPELRGAPLVESRVCQYENTSNGDFLIDRHPDFNNVWLVGGGSGHGFKHGPALGKYVSERILSGDNVDPRFSLATKAQSQERSVY